MKIKITQSGRNARNDTVRDLQNAINEMNAAIQCLSYCKGLGAELYTARLEKMISTYSDLKSKIANIG